MYAILSYNVTAARRPFRVHFPDRLASFATFASAVTAARFALRGRSPFPVDPNAPRPTVDPRPATAPSPHGDPLARPAADPAPIQKSEPSKELNLDCVKLARSVYRIRGLRGAVNVTKDVTARGRDAAVRSFLLSTECDSVIATRSLSRRDPDAKKARVRKSTAMLASRRRRQVSAAWTRQLAT